MAEHQNHLNMVDKQVELTVGIQNWWNMVNTDQVELKSAHQDHRDLGNLDSFAVRYNSDRVVLVAH